MASSSDYYRYYNDEKKKVKSYEGDISELWKIEGNLTDDLGDEISKINKEISNLQDDLKKSVRYNELFTKRMYELEEEPLVSLDKNLNFAASELREEISRVSSLKCTAESNRDYYYRMYEQKKEEEKEARKDAVKEFFGFD